MNEGDDLINLIIEPANAPAAGLWRRAVKLLAKSKHEDGKGFANSWKPLACQTVANPFSTDGRRNTLTHVDAAVAVALCRYSCSARHLRS